MCDYDSKFLCNSLKSSLKKYFVVILISLNLILGLYNWYSIKEHFGLFFFSDVLVFVSYLSIIEAFTLPLYQYSIRRNSNVNVIDMYLLLYSIISVLFSAIFIGFVKVDSVLIAAYILQNKFKDVLLLIYTKVSDVNRVGLITFLNTTLLVTAVFYSNNVTLLVQNYLYIEIGTSVLLILLIFLKGVSFNLDFNKDFLQYSRGLFLNSLTMSIRIALPRFILSNHSISGDILGTYEYIDQLLRRISRVCERGLNQYSKFFIPFISRGMSMKQLLAFTTGSLLIGLVMSFLADVNSFWIRILIVLEVCCLLSTIRLSQKELLHHSTMRLFYGGLFRYVLLSVSLILFLPLGEISIFLARFLGILGNYIYLSFRREKRFILFF
jgi:hypothetical protein